nr:divalent-cation tolerance protein CutA [Erythrobacter crassostrea]
MIWCPFPDRESARQVSSILLDENLIACANIVGESEAIFTWNGERSIENEIGVLFKTTQSNCKDLVQRLGECHPYDTPAIIGWSCENTHPSTAAWLFEQTKSKRT